MYLVRKKEPHRQVYHYWDGTNTFCKLYATGGMVKAKHILVDEKPSLRLCQMCKSVTQNLTKGVHDDANSSKSY